MSTTGAKKARKKTPGPYAMSEDRRPCNKYIMFRVSRLAELKDNGYPELEQSDFSKIISSEWNEMSPAEKKPWDDRARAARLKYKSLFPNANYQKKKHSTNAKHLLDKLLAQYGMEDCEQDADTIDFHAMYAEKDTIFKIKNGSVPSPAMAYSNMCIWQMVLHNRRRPLIGSAMVPFALAVMPPTFIPPPTMVCSQWTYWTGSDIKLSPIITSDGAVYIDSWDSQLFVINTDDGHDGYIITQLHPMQHANETMQLNLSVFFVKYVKHATHHDRYRIPTTAEKSVLQHVWSQLEVHSRHIF